jgi:hypothetical protein
MAKSPENTGLIPKRLLDAIEDGLHAILGVILLLVGIAAVVVTVYRVLTIRPFSQRNARGH